MSTYKSQYPPPRRLEDQPPATRLPRRSVTPTITPVIAAGVPTSCQSKPPKGEASLEHQLYSGKLTAQNGLAQAASRHQPATGRRNLSPNVPQPSMAQSRPIRQSTTSRLPRLDIPSSLQTPSLISSSSIPTTESPRLHVLRRKQTSVGSASSRRYPRIKDDSASPQDDKPLMDGITSVYKNPFSDAVLGISPTPPSATVLVGSDSHVDKYANGLYNDEVGPKDILPLPTPHYALSTTPSTRYSDSPGAFSMSSTPTSMSSCSPGTSLSRTSVQTKQMSPFQSRPPVNRLKTPDESNNRHPHTLSTVRESSTSSSSTSTIIAEAKQKERESPTQLTASQQSPRVLGSSPLVNKPPTQVPPELAHLVNESPVSSPVSTQPSRPSRDGTPNINGLRGPSPIIQSNIVSITSLHRRDSSTESKFAPKLATSGRYNTRSKPSSRLPSPSPSSSLPPSTRLPPREATSEIPKARAKHKTSTDPSSKSTSSLFETPKLGFFSRRAKTEPTLPLAKSDSKLQRRGPAAGTGHEGYGIHAFRGRSRSSVRTTSIGNLASAGTTVESLNQTPSTRKSSVTSTTSTEMDEFLLKRLTPVVLRGTGSSTELSNSPKPMHSSSSIDLSANLDEDGKNISKNTPQKQAETRGRKLLPSTILDSMRTGSPVEKKKIWGRRRPSESEDDTHKSLLPKSVSSRTNRTLQSAQGPTVTAAPMNCTKSQNRKDFTSSNISDGKEGGWLKSSKKSKPEKQQSKPSKRWNFFQRAHAAPYPATQMVTSANHTIQNVPSRSVAHYALMDQSGLNISDIEVLMQEASTPEELTESAPSSEEVRERERLQSPLLPPKPVLPGCFPLIPSSASSQVSLLPGNQKQHGSGLTINTDIPIESSGRYSTADLTPFTDLSLPSPSLRSLSPPEVEIDPSRNDAPFSGPTPIKTTKGNSIPHQRISPPNSRPVSPLTRPSRLTQVGRIPRVVSSRRQMHSPSPQSFSRPFLAVQPRPTAAPTTSFDSIGPFATAVRPAEPYPILHGLNALTHGSAIASISPFDDLNRQNEFFKFPPRKDSDVSYSSSSGVWSFAPAASTAVVPESGAPLSEDELWNEYDDLIDEVLLPATSQNTEDATMVRSQHPSLEPPPLKTRDLRDSSRSSEQSGAEVSYPSLHLRRSRLLAALHSTQSPASSASFSELISDYGEKKINVIDPITGRLSFPTSPSLPTGSNANLDPRSSLLSSLPLTEKQPRSSNASGSSMVYDRATMNKHRESRITEMAKTRVDGLLSTADLRFGALMTSKWLSFGRVLFSPVHFRLKDPKEDRVLVIDGLGKDWSYYCALTYPKATIYNMSSEPSLTASADDSYRLGSTLNNHRHIYHSSLKMAFPFPMHFFASVVLRFPTALPSPEHQFILSEAKRVLQPGGYLEFSVLDMDLVNMGDRARRAVRGLKMRMQVANDSISLRNISDEILAGIGRKGFVECNRCVVGIPVAGKLPRLDDAKSTTTTTTTKQGSAASSNSKTTVPLPKSRAPEPDSSFSDLLRLSSSDYTDTGITDMVARVGRWWYSRCYESFVPPKARVGDASTCSSSSSSSSSSANLPEDSLWCDDALIHECEKRGTSFKLLIGYAQKPAMDVRRTASV